MTGKQLRRRLYLFAFVDEFGPLYALFAVWFSIHGLTATQISWVFVLWAVFALVAEVPSGALADRVDRRRLVAVALSLRAVGIGLWMVWPTYAGIVVGAALWAVHSALASGTWEALVHDQLAERGEAEAYGPVMARINQMSHLGVAGGIVVASAALAVGVGIPALGWVTVAVHAVSIAAALSLPSVALAPADDDEAPSASQSSLSLRSWWRTLCAGLRVTWGAPLRFRLLVMGAVLEALFVLDEYQPLLAHVRGVEASMIPLLVLAVWVGLLGGGELAARRPTTSTRTLGALLVVGAAVALAGLLSGLAAALALLGVAYAAQNTAWVVLDARFQATIPNDVRATVTSVRAFFGGLLNAAAFVIVGWLSTSDDPTPGVAALLVVLAAAGLWIMAERRANELASQPTSLVLSSECPIQTSTELQPVSARYATGRAP